jgi:hypothetical protein
MIALPSCKTFSHSLSRETVLLLLASLNKPVKERQCFVVTKGQTAEECCCAVGPHVVAYKCSCCLCFNQVWHVFNNNNKL